MKSNNALRGQTEVFGADDLLKKATKLEPVKKSGKEKRSFINSLDEDEEDIELLLQKKESILDYFDDGEEEDDEEWDEDEDWDEEEWDEEETDDEDYDEEE